MNGKCEGIGRGTPLAELQGLTATQLLRFEALRILSAEELLAMSGSVEHRRRLATYLGTSLRELAALRADVQRQLDPGAAEDVEMDSEGQPADGDPERTSKQGEGSQAEGPMEEREMARTRLRNLKPQPLSAEQLGRLRALHVTTAEELIAMSAQPKTRKLLQSHLDVTARQLTSLLSKVKKQLDPQVVRDMLKREPGGPRGGVLDPIPASKRRGRHRG